MQLLVVLSRMHEHTCTHRVRAVSCTTLLMPRYSQHASYLMCRTLGHAWGPIAADRVGRMGGDPLWLRCERCDTERHDSISIVTGALVTRQYVYEDSYRHAFDNDFADAAPTRSDFRRMLLSEAIIKQKSERALRAAADAAAAEHPSSKKNTHKKAG